jgi:GNAT superfamily N-acetyltransferase
MDDADAIDALMKASIREIFPAVYDARQTASTEIHVTSVDRMMLADGTYFVIEDAGEIVACGGWSRRAKFYTGSGAHDDDTRIIDPATEAARVRAMFTRADHARRGLGTRILEACESSARAEGFTRLTLMATISGVPLYERFGFVEIDRGSITTPDGVQLECVEMVRPVRPS